MKEETKCRKCGKPYLPQNKDAGSDRELERLCKECYRLRYKPGKLTLSFPPVARGENAPENLSWMADELHTPEVNRMQDVIKELGEQLAQKLDDWIIHQLEEKGWKFSSNEALLNFAKTRLTIVKAVTEPGWNKLYVINKENPHQFICAWNYAPIKQFCENNIFVTLQTIETLGSEPQTRNPAD